MMGSRVGIKILRQQRVSPGLAAQWLCGASTAIVWQLSAAVSNSSDIA